MPALSAVRVPKRTCRANIAATTITTRSATEARASEPMRTVLRFPSTLSAVPNGCELQLYDKGDRLAASITATPTNDVLLRLDLGHAVVARGDLLSPEWRRGLATDVRLCYSSAKEDRTPLLRFLSDLATAWDAHLRAPVTPDQLLRVAQELERLRVERNGGAQ